MSNPNTPNPHEDELRLAREGKKAAEHLANDYKVQLETLQKTFDAHAKFWDESMRAEQDRCMTLKAELDIANGHFNVQTQHIITMAGQMNTMYAIHESKHTQVETLEEKLKDVGLARAAAEEKSKELETRVTALQEELRVANQQLDATRSTLQELTTQHNPATTRVASFEGTAQQQSTEAAAQAAHHLAHSLDNANDVDRRLNASVEGRRA
jgi:chromosome segregation ATPase